MCHNSEDNAPKIYDIYYTNNRIKILLLKSYSVYIKEYIHFQVHLHHNSFLRLKVRNLIINFQKPEN